MTPSSIRLFYSLMFAKDIKANSQERMYAMDV
jgi:hypothetical protein